jgi:hypothetical protein
MAFAYPTQVDAFTYGAAITSREGYMSDVNVIGKYNSAPYLKLTAGYRAGELYVGDQGSEGSGIGAATGSFVLALTDTAPACKYECRVKGVGSVVEACAGGEGTGMFEFDAMRVCVGRTVGVIAGDGSCLIRGGPVNVTCALLPASGQANTVTDVEGLEWVLKE